MVGDCLVAWCHSALQNLNPYTPQEVSCECNKVKSVVAEFLHHNDMNRPFHVNWGDFLSKCFNKMPVG
ncbi:hypothetical protein HK096_005927, partial [Nowakowskiella sp. JEL0078]